MSTGTDSSPTDEDKAEYLLLETLQEAGEEVTLDELEAKIARRVDELEAEGYDPPVSYIEQPGSDDPYSKSLRKAISRCRTYGLIEGTGRFELTETGRRQLDEWLAEGWTDEIFDEESGEE